MATFLDWLQGQLAAPGQTGPQGLTPPAEQNPDVLQAQYGLNPSTLAGLAGQGLGEVGSAVGAPLRALNADQALATALAGTVLTSAFRGGGVNLPNSVYQGTRAFLSRLNEGGPAAAISGAQHDWETTPDPGAGQINLGGPFAPGLPLIKGLAAAPLDPASYVGGPAGRLAGKGAELVGPTTTLGKGLLQTQAANVAFADAAQAAMEAGKGLLGAGLQQIPLAGRLFAESGASKLRGEAQGAGDIAANLQGLAGQGVAPTEAGQAWQYLAGKAPAPTAAEAAASTAEAAQAANLAAAAGGAAPPAAAAPVTAEAAQAAARAAAGGVAPEVAGAAAPEVADAAAVAAHAGLAPVAQAAGVDISRVPPSYLKQILNHGQQDLREAEGLAAALGLPSTPPGADRPLDAVLQAAQAAAPDLDARFLLSAADRIAASEGLPRVRSTGPGGVQEAVGTVNQIETVDDVAKALRLAGSPPEAVRLAQAQFLNDRYGPTFPASPGQPQYTAVAQRLAREAMPGGAPVPPVEGVPGPAPPVAGGAPEAAPAEGIPFGRAQIDRGLLQANLDAGMPMAEARAKAVVNVEAGGAPPAPEAAPAPPSPPAGAEGTPPVAGPETAVSLAGGAPTYTAADAAAAAAARQTAAAGQVTAEDVAGMSTELIRRRFGVGDAQAARIKAGEPPPGGFAPSGAPPSPEPNILAQEPGTLSREDFAQYYMAGAEPERARRIAGFDAQIAQAQAQAEAMRAAGDPGWRRALDAVPGLEAERTTWQNLQFKLPDPTSLDWQRRTAVMKAIDAGTPIPADVLADYPDLAARATVAPPSAPTGAAPPADILSPPAPPPLMEGTPPALPVEAAPIPDVGLPKSLAGATPRYGYGGNNYTLDFASDIDKAFYIVAQNAKRSRQDAAYLSFLQGIFPDLEETTLRGIGQQVRGSLKSLAQQADPEAGSLTLPRTFDQFLPSREAPPVPGVAPAEMPPTAPAEPAAAPAAPTSPPLMEGTPAALGTEVPPAVSQELAAARQNWQTVNRTSTDPLERIAAQQRLQAAQVAQDDALKAALGVPTSTAQPDVLGAATTKSAAQAAAAAQASRQMWLDQAAAQAGASPDLLAQMQRDAPGLVDAYTKAQQTWQDILTRLPGEAPATLGDAYAQAQAAQGLPSPDQTKLVSEIGSLLRTYGKDVNLADPADATDALTAAFVTGRAAAMRAAGERTTPLTLPVLGTVMNTIKQLAMLNLGMPLKYTADALLHSTAFAGKGIPDLGATAIQAVKTGEEAGLGPVAAQWFTDHGLSPPAALSRGQSLAQDVAATGSAAEGGKIAQAGEAIASVPDRLGIPERVQNAGQWLGNITEALTRTIGTTARAGGFMEGYDRYMAQNADALAGRFSSLLGDAAAPIEQALTENQGILTAQSLGPLLEQGGVQDLGQARQALALLGDAQRAAKEAGLQMADRYSLGAPSLTNADEIAANFIPFHVFASRSLPIMGEMFATNPKLYVLYQQYYDALNEYDKQQGILPGTRLAQRLPTWHTPLGTVYLDPLAYTAESRLFKQTYPSPKMTELGQNYQQAERLGFGLAQPWITLAEMSGQLGGRPPAGVTEADPLIGLGIQAATGNVAPAPWENWGNLRPFGPTPVDPQHIAPGADAYDPTTPVKKRLAEMSIERTGQVNNPAYALAAATPGSPLFQEAARDVALRSLLEMASHTGGLPIEHRTDAQAHIEQAMAGLPLVNAAGGGWTQPLYPTLPYPTGPLDPRLQVTADQHQQALIARAMTNPYALGYQMAYGGGEPTAGGSPYSQLKDAAIRAYTQGSASERAAVMADPRKWGFVQDYLLRQSPIFQPQTPGMGAPAGRPFLQDILGVP